MELIITEDMERLQDLEGIIQKNLRSFYEVGRALMKIRDEELYKIKNGGAYGTFEEYCKKVWDFKRTYAFYMIESAKVIENVHRGEQNLPLPSSERQTRPLAQLEPARQIEAWQKAVETAPEGKVTAAHVSKVVKEMQQPTKTKKTPALPPNRGETIPTYAFHFADIAISQLEHINMDDPKREAAFNRVMKWIQDNI